MTRPRALTAKGAATRQRIVEAAADRVLERGVGGTSLDDVRAATGTSKSQLFHYFPGGKHELVQAIVACQGERVLQAQQPTIDALDSWDAWADWRDRVLAHYRANGGLSGCPIGSLASEAAPEDAQLRSEIAAYFDGWQRRLADGVRRMQERGLVAADADADALGTALLAAIQGGLLLSRTAGSLAPLEIALDAAIAQLHGRASVAVA